MTLERDLLQDGVDAARNVCQSWENGDLAAAVRAMGHWAQLVSEHLGSPSQLSCRLLMLEQGNQLRLTEQSFNSTDAAILAAKKERDSDPAWNQDAWLLCLDSTGMHLSPAPIAKEAKHAA